MRKIFKYPISVIPEQNIKAPFGARWLDVQVQGEVLCLWAVVDPELIDSEYRISIKGTGVEISELEMPNIKHIGTVQMGSYVWHVFVER